METVLPLPNLDDRRWTDLVEEGRALIPFYAPEWTDHNIHDPGITLVELFAWLAEMDLFELNQVTDAHRRKFLALAGIAPEPPRPARSLLALTLAAGKGPLNLDAGLEFEGRDPFGNVVPFRSTHALTALPGELAAVLSERDGHIRNLTTPWRRAEPILPFGDDPGPGSSFSLGIRVREAWPAGQTLSLGFSLADLAPEAGAAERRRIIGEAVDAERECGPLEDCGCCSPVTSEDEPVQPPDIPADSTLWHHDVRLVWEVLTGRDQWTRLRSGEHVHDSTRAFSLPGRVLITLPTAVYADSRGGIPEKLVWIRARIVRGRHDAAPELRGIAFNAVDVEQAVPAVITLRITPSIPLPPEPGPLGELIDLDLEISPQGTVANLAFTDPLSDRPSIRLLGYSAADRTITFEALSLTGGTGSPSLEMAATSPPLMAGSVRVTSLEGGTTRSWQIRPDFAASKRADAHVTVDAVGGVITTGDGEHGRTAPHGSILLATADVTRAQAGNVQAGAIDRIADSPRNRALFADLIPPAGPLATVWNVVPATGGATAETVGAAVARARDERERAYRAVTLDDHVTLARDTPGARIARAEARANFHPGFPCLQAPGIVTVLVLPKLPAGRPEPTAGLRRLVSRYLSRRRIIGTRVEVAGPVYVRVRIIAEVESLAGWEPDALVTAISAALDRFFDPLQGGPEGTGWPFGRDVYRSEILQLIDETPGVAHVRSLELVKGDEPPSCGNLCLGPTGLVDAGEHEITIVTGSKQ